MIDISQGTSESSETRSVWLRSTSTSGAPVHTEYGPIPVTLRKGQVEEGWELLLPFMLFVEREDDGWYVVSDDIFGAYGDAANFREALREYISALIDHFEFLERELRINPNDPIRRESEFARRYLQRILA